VDADVALLLDYRCALRLHDFFPIGSWFGEVPVCGFEKISPGLAADDPIRIWHV
jgi:hypothetical protein